MSDYIKKDDAMTAVSCYMMQTGIDERPYTYARDEIYKLPAADVVEVVRCKDCIHCADDYINTGMGYMPAFTCELGGINDSDSVDPTDYCSYGERKE